MFRFCSVFDILLSHVRVIKVAIDTAGDPIAFYQSTGNSVKVDDKLLKIQHGIIAVGRNIKTPNAQLQTMSIHVCYKVK